MVEYQPGVCNIGTAERARRRNLGYLGFLAGVLVVVGVIVADLDPRWALASAAPFYGGVIGVLQARAGFCAGFGLAGVYDVSDAGDERTDVSDADARRADRWRAIRMQVEAAVGAVVAAGAAYLLALVV